jgi:hypothetical protein
MTLKSGFLNRPLEPLVLVYGLFFLTGCSSSQRTDSVVVCKPEFRGLIIAVAPAQNQSATVDLDPYRLADLMALELARVNEIAVVPLARVVGVLENRGWGTVQSPKQVLELGQSVGADAVLVFAVMRYDPYNPPSVAITAQLFETGTKRRGLQASHAAGGFDDGELAGDSTGDSRLLGQMQRVFDASQKDTLADIRAFANRRSSGESPYGWREYVVSQQEFFKYCCYRTVGAMFLGPSESGVADARDEVRRP